MRITIIVCLSLSLLASLAGIILLRSDNVQGQYWQAQRGVQRILAKSKDEELRLAIGRTQDIEKTLFVNHGLGRGLVWISVGSSGLALALFFLNRKKKQPIKSITDNDRAAPRRV